MCSNSAEKSIQFSFKILRFSYMNLSAVKSIVIQEENTACLSDKYQKRPLVTAMYFIYLFVHLFI